MQVQFKVDRAGTWLVLPKCVSSMPAMRLPRVTHEVEKRSGLSQPR